MPPCGDLESGEEQHLTPHDGVALSQNAVFIDDDTLVFATNVDREMLALARVTITDGRADPPEILVGRDDAELAGIEHLGEGRLMLNWNAAGRSELAFFDLATGEITPGPALPAEIAGTPEATVDGRQAVITVSGAAWTRLRSRSVSPSRTARSRRSRKRRTMVSTSPRWCALSFAPTGRTMAWN